MSGGREELPDDMLALLRSMGLAPAAASAERALLPNGDPARDPQRVHELQSSSPGAEALAALARDGVVRLNNVLSAGLCVACGAAVCDALRRAVAAGRDAYSPSRDTPFGNVDEPGKRWDMYLDYHGDGSAARAAGGEAGASEAAEAAAAAGRTYRSALAALLGASSAPLRALFDTLFGGADASFYELAALVSDAGAQSQRVHSDTVHQPSCPLYTCFVALQDTDLAMGCTHFIKGSHNSSEAHRSLRHTRGDYLADAEYSAATLARGDAVVMDSRLFHFGGANDARRRKLLYFTLQNPAFASAPGVGSKLDSLHLSLHDIAPPACA